MGSKSIYPQFLLLCSWTASSDMINMSNSVVLCSSVIQLKCLPHCRRRWWKSSTPRCAINRLCTEVLFPTTWCVPDSCRARWTLVRSVLFLCGSHNVATIAWAINLHLLTIDYCLGAEFVYVQWWSGLLLLIWNYTCCWNCVNTGPTLKIEACWLLLFFIPA